MIVFRNDMISDPKDIKSVAELLETDMTMTSVDDLKDDMKKDEIF